MNPATRIPVALVILGGALGAQSPQPVVIDGQPLPGGGSVIGIRYVHLNSSGEWLVQVTTDLPFRPSVVRLQ